MSVQNMDLESSKPDIDNLYNCIYNKTRKVAKYLKELNYNPSWDITQKTAFDKAIQQALNAGSAIESLEMIGYNYKSLPKIYGKINSMGNNTYDKDTK